MVDHYCILPCNGLDKCAGTVSRELAIKLCENAVNVILCPVFYRVSETKYNKIASEQPLLVIDGCPTRCASKLAAEKNLKITKKIIIAEEAKSHGIKLEDNLRITGKEQALIDTLFNELNKADDRILSSASESGLSYEFGYEIFQNAPSTFEPVANAPTPVSYRVGAGDNLIITVWGQTQLNYQLTVARDGYIVVPDVGKVQVGGQTIDQVKNRLLSRMSQVYEGLKEGKPNASTFLDVSLGNVRTIL